MCEMCTREKHTLPPRVKFKSPITRSPTGLYCTLHSVYCTPTFSPLYMQQYITLIYICITVEPPKYYNEVVLQFH